MSSRMKNVCNFISVTFFLLSRHFGWQQVIHDARMSSRINACPRQSKNSGGGGG